MNRIRKDRKNIVASCRQEPLKLRIALLELDAILLHRVWTVFNLCWAGIFRWIPIGIMHMLLWLLFGPTFIHTHWAFTCIAQALRLGRLYGSLEPRGDSIARTQSFFVHRCNGSCQLGPRSLWNLQWFLFYANYGMGIWEYQVYGEYQRSSPLPKKRCIKARSVIELIVRSYPRYRNDHHLVTYVRYRFNTRASMIQI